MSAQSNERNPQVVVIPVGSLAANATIPAMYVPRAGKLLSAHLVNNAAIAASDTNYCTLTLLSGATTLATLDSRAANQGALVQREGKAFVVASEDLASGASLSLQYAEAGTIQLTEAVLVLHYWVKESA
jgi:hypothetical protein